MGQVRRRKVQTPSRSASRYRAGGAPPRRDQFRRSVEACIYSCTEFSDLCSAFRSLAASRRITACRYCKNRFIHQTPVRFDDFRILSGQSACNLHFRSEPRERGGKTDHHIVEEYGIDRRKKTFFL